jgi:asparagine synthase (glutamine-hydrolysing)
MDAMGAFYLIRRSAAAQPDPLRAALDESFARQGFPALSQVRGPDWDIGVFGRLVAAEPTLWRGEDGTTAIAAGTLFYKGEAGRAALPGLAADWRAEAIDWAALHGSYAVAIAEADRVALFTDRTGTLHLYRSDDDAIFSTSFLALAEALPKLTVDEDGFYDTVFHEAPHGGRTVFRQIRLFPAGRILRLTDRADWRDAPPLAPGPVDRASLDDQAGRCLTALERPFADYIAGFGRLIDTALSGGYDSRLILAMLRRAGVAPIVHVYGKAGDADVTTARRIADGEGFALAHTDKSRFDPVPVEAFPEIVERNFLAFDGYPNDGLFNNGGDLATRKQRCGKGELMLNGGGGEIFRNFFYLPDRPMAAADLVGAFYSQYNPVVCTGRFDERGYRRRFAELIAESVGAAGETLTRQQVELAYPLFRCRYWMGRNNSVNNRLGFAATPFCTPAPILTAATVGMALKNAGRLQSRMIALADPKLAAYPSAYGFAFDSPPPARYRLKAALDRLRPILLRANAYRLKNRRPAAPPLYLREPYRRAVLGPHCELVTRWVDPAKATDGQQLNRIASLEYLLRRLGSRVAEE